MQPCDERVIINFGDKNVVIARFRDKTAYVWMGILPLKKRVNRDKCSFATKQRMFGVFAIDEILRYRGTRFPSSRTLCHPGMDWEWVTRVTVTREGNFTRSGIDEVDEAEIFEGAENRLTMNQTYTWEFQCKYELQRYPFDTQVNTYSTYIQLLPVQLG